MLFTYGKLKQRLFIIHILLKLLAYSPVLTITIKQVNSQFLYLKTLKITSRKNKNKIIIIKKTGKYIYRMYGTYFSYLTVHLELHHKQSSKVRKSSKNWMYVSYI